MSARNEAWEALKCVLRNRGLGLCVKRHMLDGIIISSVVWARNLRHETYDGERKEGLEGSMVTVTSMGGGRNEEVRRTIGILKSSPFYLTTNGPNVTRLR